MLGDVNSVECISLMKLIETQSKETLSAWAITFVKENYLMIYENACPEDKSYREMMKELDEYLARDKKLSELKTVLKEMRKSNGDVKRKSKRCVSL